MRRAILAWLLIVAVSSAAYADNTYSGMIGLFADANHRYQKVCPFEGPFAGMAKMWIWGVASTEETVGHARFRIVYPSNVLQSEIVANEALVNMSIGDLPGGIQVGYNGCRGGWHWLYCQTIYVTTHDETWIRVAEYPGSGLIQFKTCGDAIWKPAKEYTRLYLNSDLGQGTKHCVPPEELVVGAEDASWGAIKSLFAE